MTKPYRPLDLLTLLARPQILGWLNVMIAAFVLIAVYTSQYVFGLHPCELCYYQRIPYAILLFVGLMTATARYRTLVLITGGMIIALWGVNMGLGLFHLGVEQHWWPYHSGCSTSIYDGSTDPADLLARIKSAPVVRCDEAVPFLFGMSMAFYNFLLSFGMFMLNSITILYGRFRG